MLTFVGALIVFSTFVVKDAIRDHLRDVGDAIDRAQNSYEVAKHFQDAEVTAKFRTSQILQSLVRIETPASSKDEIFRQNAQWQSKDPYDWIRFVSQVEDSVTPLLRELKTPALNEEVHKLEKQKASFMLQLSWYGSVVIALGGKKVPIDNAEKEKVSREGVALAVANGKLIGLATDVGLHVILTATRRKQRIQSWYEACTWASYFLYALGWGLGLAGRLVGVGEIGGGGD